MLARVLNMAPADNPVLRLYSNEVAISESTSLADIDEVSRAGYAPVELAPGGWTITQSGDTVRAEYAEVVFSFPPAASALDVHGYFVTDASGSLLLWCESTPVPYRVPASGGAVSLAPALEFD